MRNLEIKKIYEQYDDEVVDYMEHLISSLKKQYGKIEDEWYCSLKLIAYNYNIIVKCQKDIDANGFTKLDGANRMAKNPCISILNNAQAYLMKLLGSFGLTVLAKSKIKNIDASDTTIESLLA